MSAGRWPLTRHPDVPCDALKTVAVEVERPGPQQLLLRYRLTGMTDDLVFPPAVGGRSDGLWRHTCFEAFVQSPPEAGYRELNYATGQWAAYRFDGYREGMADADVGPPDTSLSGPGGYVADVLVVWDLDLPPDAIWRVGVAMVVEETGGRLSYWALRHPAAKPDFHHPDGFILDLPPP